VQIIHNHAAVSPGGPAAMLEEGIYVVAFSYPVVAKGKARIRTQMSAALSHKDIALALEAFGRVKRALKL
jgi:glycine C-acetyltransferase